MVDPNTGLQSSQVLSKLWDREQSNEQLKSVLRLISVTDCPLGKLTENPHTTPSTAKQKLRQRHIKAVLGEFILHNEVFHIVLGLFLSMLGLMFELPSSGSSMNMFNFIALTIYLPIFLGSNVMSTRVASSAPTFKQNSGGRFFRVCPLKDLMLQSKDQAVPMTGSKEAFLPATAVDRTAGPLISEDTLPVPDASRSQHKSSRTAEDSTSLTLEAAPIYTQVLDFQAWKPMRLQKHIASLVDMEADLRRFVLKSFSSFLAKIRNIAFPNYLVIRDGEFMVIEACNLVVGDVLVLAEGQIVPCDCTILPTYFTQAHSLSMHLPEYQMCYPAFPVDVSNKLRPFCPEAVSYGLARKQPLVYCTFPTSTAANIIAHYKIHSLYSTLCKSGAKSVRRVQKAKRIYSVGIGSTLHTASLPHQDTSEELTSSRLYRSRRERADSSNPLLESNFSGRGQSMHANSIVDDALSFYVNKLGLQDSVQSSLLLCGQKILQIKNPLPITLENVSISTIVSAFFARVHANCQTETTEFSAEKFARLSSLCMKVLVDELGARKTSSSSVSIAVTRGIRVCVTALGKDTSVFQRSERLLSDLQQSLDFPARSNHSLSRSLRRSKPPKPNVSSPATLIEGKEALTETISMPASFLSSTLSMQSFFRVISIISLWISVFLIIIPVLPRLALSSELRRQYVSYWDPAQSDQLALFAIGFIPSVCAALTFGLVSGLFLHRNTVALRPIISVSSKHLSSLVQRNVHIHTLGALEAIGFTNALVIDESLLVNISGSQVHEDAPGFWGPVAMNLSFIYVAGENTTHRLYLDEEIRLQGSILAQDIVTPLWPSIFRYLVQVNAVTGQYVIIGARRRFHGSYALQHSAGVVESTEQIDHSHQFSFYEGQHADITFAQTPKAPKQSRRLYDTLLCLMRFLACVTMGPADVAHALKNSTTEQTIFTPDYAFEIVAFDSESTSSRSPSRECSFHEQKDPLYATTNRRTRTSTSSEASLAKPSPTLVELSLSRPIRPDVITSSYFSGFEEYLCKYLTMNQARTLRSIRTSRYSATVRKYGRLITPGCLQDSHLSVAQIHPLVTYPLCVYLVYIEKQAPVIVVKSSSPEDLISVCKYTIADDMGSTIAGDHHFFTLAADSDHILFYYRRMDDARRQLATQQINKLGATCHELVLYAMSALHVANMDLSDFSRETIPALDLIYIGAMGFHTTQKHAPTAFISRFTDLSNGANLIITTRRSSNAGQQHAAFGLCRPKEMCANPLTDVQTLLSALNLTVQTNASHGRDNLGEVRDSDWNTSNAEADKPCHDISLPTVELRPKKPKGSNQKQPIVVPPLTAQTRRCLVTTDLKAVSLYTLSRIHDNNGKLLLSSRPNRRHNKSYVHLQRKRADMLDDWRAVTADEHFDCVSRYPLVLSDAEEEQNSTQQDTRVFHARRTQHAKYHHRSAQLAQNRQIYAQLKATSSELNISDESFVSDETQVHSLRPRRQDATISSTDCTLGYPIIAPQQTWKAVEHFMVTAQRFYNPPKRTHYRAPIREGELLGEHLPNVFVIPESNSVDVASALSNAGAFVTLVLPSRPSSYAYTIEEEDVFKDNTTAATLLQTAGDSKTVPSYLSVCRSNISFSRKPDFLIIGYSPGYEPNRGKQQLGIPKESYVQLRRLLRERISVAYTFGHHGLQHLRDVALEAPHFFLSMFPAFISTVRSSLLQGIFPLTLALTITTNITLECILYRYEMINMGLRPWYYPPTTVGIILLTNALVNDFMIPKVLQFSLRFHRRPTQIEGKLRSRSLSQHDPLVKQMINHIHRAVIRMKGRHNAHSLPSVTAYTKQPPSRYHLKALMNVAEKLSKNLRTSSLTSFSLIFIVISAIALLPSINYRYYGTTEFFKPMYLDRNNLFVSSLSRKFVIFTTLLMVLLFMSFSIAAFFIAIRLPIVRSMEGSMHRCFRVLHVGVFFAIQFLVIYAVLLLPIRFPILSLLISGFTISEETSEFWNSVFLSAGISCLVLVGVILEQSIPILN